MLLIMQDQMSKPEVLMFYSIHMLYVSRINVKENTSCMFWPLKYVLGYDQNASWVDYTMSAISARHQIK